GRSGASRISASPAPTTTSTNCWNGAKNLARIASPACNAPRHQAGNESRRVAAKLLSALRLRSARIERSQQALEGASAPGRSTVSKRRQTDGSLPLSDCTVIPLVAAPLPPSVTKRWKRRWARPSATGEATRRPLPTGENRQSDPKGRPPGNREGQ